MRIKLFQSRLFLIRARHNKSSVWINVFYVVVVLCILQYIFLTLPIISKEEDGIDNWKIFFNTLNNCFYNSFYSSGLLKGTARNFFYMF